jgi:uncharacterized protein HemX
MSFPSAGETGGMFAGAVALLVAVGHGLKWWLGWTDRRASTRAAKLDAWQSELFLREARLDAEQAQIIAEIKDQLAGLKDSNDQLRREHAALLGGFQLVAGALRTLDPDNSALARAEELLKSAFPLEPVPPDDMTRTILAAKRSDD